MSDEQDTCPRCGAPLAPGYEDGPLSDGDSPEYGYTCGTLYDYVGAHSSRACDYAASLRRVVEAAVERADHHPESCECYLCVAVDEYRKEQR